MKHLVEMVVFARVVEARGFSAAARILGMTTSGVSRSVTRLEAHVGGRLLNRSTRALSVTELGQTVYAGCARIAETAREVEAFAGHYASTPGGRLKVSAPVSYGQLCIAPRLPAFVAQFPEIDVQLDLTERFVDVVGESYDVAICIAASLPPGVVARRLARTSTLLVAAPSYLARAGTPSEPADLSFHSIVAAEPGGTTKEVRLLRGLTESRAILAARVTINDGSAIVAAARAEMGIALVPDYAARQALCDGALVRVLPEWTLADPGGDVAIQAIYAPTRHLPRKVRAFIDFCVDMPPEREAPAWSVLARAA